MGAKLNVLLMGKNGQVGFELQRSLAILGEVTAVDQADCDLSDAVAIRQLVAQAQPDVIVNSAVYTAVDKAESEPDLARAINATAPGILAEEAHRLGALLVHYSTDYVFDDAMPGAYLETDATNPRSVYGGTKRDGEIAVRAATDNHLILRTSWVVGAHGGNFAKTMLRLVAERESLNVVADQWGTPTSAALLADITAHLIRQWKAKDKRQFPYGTYHVVAGGETNWCDYARFVIGEALQAGKAMKATPEAIKAIPAADYPTPAQRPYNSRLDTASFKNTFGLDLPHWQIGLRHILQQIL